MFSQTCLPMVFAVNSRSNWGKLFGVLRAVRGKAEGQKEDSEHSLRLSLMSGTGTRTCLPYCQLSQQASEVDTVAPTFQMRRQAPEAYRTCSRYITMMGGSWMPAQFERRWSSVRVHPKYCSQRAKLLIDSQELSTQGP